MTVSIPHNALASRVASALASLPNVAAPVEVSRVVPCREQPGGGAGDGLVLRSTMRISHSVIINGQGFESCDSTTHHAIHGVTEVLHETIQVCDRVSRYNAVGVALRMTV